MPGIDDVRSGVADPPTSAAPMVRWWWFGPSVARQELERELTAMADAGLGGVEVAYVYPLAAATAEFGSDAFLADLRFAAERAHQLGLRFDLTLGSGWSFGGPHISTDLAARQLHWERREIGPRPLEVPLISAWPGDELIAGYVGTGSLQEVPASYEQLPVVDGRLIIQAGTGPRVVLLGYARLTGQNVKRAAAGAEGPVLDHYSAAATQGHLHAVGDPMLDAVPAELVGSVFCDSLEVYGADWTPRLPAEFARRRGYELIPMLCSLTVDGPDAGQLRADFHRTLVELYEENFVAVCQRWAASRGVPFRLQGYGTPPATISSYRFADLFEGEGWGWREITQTRWASSAAHLYGRSVVSAEAWTWVHSPSFRATLLDLKGEAHEHLLNGINQLIGHGWPYSPSGAPGLGWFFYAAGALDDRNPWWPAMPEFTKYLSRLCWLLQQGEPVADVALYIPNQDLFATMGRAQGGSLDAWRQAHRRIPAAIPAIIRNAGLDYDLIDDDALMITPPERYQVVIVPTATMIMDATRTWLGRIITAGGSVIMIDSTVQVPGAITVASEELTDVLRTAVVPDLGISPPTPEIGFVHRRVRGSDIYVVINTGPRTRTFGIAPRTTLKSYEQWDALSGQVLDTGTATEGIELTLHPYDATVIMLTEHMRAEPAEARPSTGSGHEGTGSGREGTSSGREGTSSGREGTSSGRLLLSDPLRVTFGDEPAQPVELPHIWEDDPGRRHYSGAATYTTSINLTAVDDPVWIDFGDCEMRDGGSIEHDMVGPSYRVGVRGPVGEVAQVWVNGIDCGLAWAPPYRVEITDALRSGSNEIKITVYNTAANALAADEHITQLAAQSEARYGRRFRMQDLDQAMATVRSGLLQVPSLIISPSAKPRTPVAPLATSNQ